MKRLYLSFRRYSKLVEVLKSMPKDNTEHIQLAQKQRIKIRERSQFYSPGTVNLQVLGSGARGTSSSIYLFSEQARYLFNCGEGTQRLAHEHKTKLTRMEHIFLTRKSWKQFGGVPGLCLTLQEIGVPKINLHGPSGIPDIFQSTKKFVVLRNMKVETPECKEGEFYEDSVLQVFYVPLYKNNQKEVDTQESNVAQDTGWSEEEVPESFKQNADDETDYYGYENRNSKEKTQLDAPKSPEKSKKKVAEHVMSYICKLQPRTGTLNLEACVEKGVRPGPLLGRLKNGFDITLPDGTVVKADDVRGPSSPGSVFIFVDIPDESYLSALLSCERFIPHQANASSEEDSALVIVHFTPEQIVENPLYQEWMDRFSPSTHHMMVNERNTFTGYFASHRIQRQLNELDAFVFPMLKEPHPYMEVDDMAVDISEIEASPAKKFKLDANGSEDPEDEKFSKYLELGVKTCYHIRPAKGFDRNRQPYNHPEKVMEETYINAPELHELVAEYKKKANEIISRSKKDRDNEYPRVITFGTGSCIPNKTRNVSANLIQFSKDNCALLDCGEGTLGQLVRFYGRDGADEVLKNLKVIFISHLHADHHLGLINILNRRRQLTDERVTLLAPYQINYWLTFYNDKIEEICSTFELFPCSDLLGWNAEEEEIKKFHEKSKMLEVKTCRVSHCPHSFGVSFVTKNLMQSERNPNETVKITYSGDTIPSEELIDIGMNSDILIHEATMEDDLWKEARIKMHSTVSQAIEVGRKMRARYVILTHFSQRYAKIPLMPNNLENVAVGFDNMEVTLNDLPVMHNLYEPLKVMFAEHFELIEQKNLRRKYKNERKIQIDMPDGNGKNKVKKFNSSDED